MAGLMCTKGRLVDGAITIEMSATQLSETIMSGTIVILNSVFAQESDALLSLRHAVFTWGQATPSLDQPDPQANCHCLESGVSRRQLTPHIYHSYNFNRVSQLPGDLSTQLYRCFEPLRVLQNSITGNRAEFEIPGSGASLHPQIIQYPLGGGLFGRHFHPLVPQRIGLIAALSRRGVDYDKGGTCFDIDGTVIDIEPYHDFGDVALFRFDIPHWVNPSDLRRKFGWGSESGRWTMVLPYY